MCVCVCVCVLYLLSLGAYYMSCSFYYYVFYDLSCVEYYFGEDRVYKYNKPGRKIIMIIPKSIGSKVDVIAPLRFELAHYFITVQHASSIEMHKTGYKQMIIITIKKNSHETI